MGRTVKRWKDGKDFEILEYADEPRPPRVKQPEYRFNRCNRCGRTLKSTIRKSGQHWHWSCFMCLNLQRYPK